MKLIRQRINLNIVDSASDFIIHLFTIGIDTGLCGGPKKSPCTIAIVQIMFFFWSFEISEGILRNQKFIGLDSFSNQYLMYLDPFG